MTKLIFGCGYLGSRVARLWQDAGQRVTVVTRSAGRATALGEHGYNAIVADVTEPDTLTNLPPAESVLFAVGFDRSAAKATGQSIDDVYAGGVRNVLASLPMDVGRIVYISTTGVYGPASGDWVNEQTPPDPQRDGGRASLAAEQALAAHPLGRRGIILRMVGLYGPGRVPFLDRLRAGEPIPAIDSGHLNLIHIDDAAAVVVAAENLALDTDQQTPRIYCVSDGNPVERGDYYREVARLIAAPEPQFITPDHASPRAVRAATDRRVRNDRMLAEVNVELDYADYRAGLAAILS